MTIVDKLKAEEGNLLSITRMVILYVLSLRNLNNR